MDVTEEAELTTALRKSEGELRQMLDFAPQLIGVLGPQLEKLYANRVALAYYGVSLDERRQSLATGRPRPIRDAQHHKQQQRRKRHRAVSRQVVRHDRGNPREAEASVGPLFDRRDTRNEEDDSAQRFRNAEHDLQLLWIPDVCKGCHRLRRSHQITNCGEDRRD